MEKSKDDDMSDAKSPLSDNNMIRDWNWKKRQICSLNDINESITQKARLKKNNSFISYKPRAKTYKSLKSLNSLTSLDSDIDIDTEKNSCTSLTCNIDKQ